MKTDDMNNKSFQTRAVHAGERTPPGNYIPVSTPIWPSASYSYDRMADLDAALGGMSEGYAYLRYSSPTVAAFEQAVASLEGAQAAQAYASGMAALHAVLLAAGARAGMTVVAAMDLYGATFTLLRQLFQTLGVQACLVDPSDLDAVQTALHATGSPLLLVETISNPLLKVADIPALAQICAACKPVEGGEEVALLVDNTFATPWLFNPLAHGAAYAVHSATKYLAGHGDVLAGVTATSLSRKEKLYELNKLMGGVLGPFEAWLALRGLKTLPLRIRQQCQSTQQIAEWLQKHPAVAHVHYPGLANHPQNNLAQRLFSGRGAGGVLSFEIAGADTGRIFRFMEALQLCQAATTLGDIYSLVLHPATSSHRSLSAAERAQVGIPDGLVRLSVGVEAVEDILDDLQTALAAVA